MTGKKERPSTEPMYSGGNINDFPITTGYDSVQYTSFIGSHLFNSKNIVICQNFHDGYFSGCFAPSKMYSPRPTLSWGIRKNYGSFIKFVKENWQRTNGRSLKIYSLACDENLGFGVVFMENYGTKQSIVVNLENIKKKREKGFKITACASWGSKFYIVMTKDTNEYEGRPQSCFTCKSWTEAKSKIHKYYEKRKGITGICYATGLGKYFVFMTETQQRQAYKRFDNNVTRDNWMQEKHNEGFHVAIIFKDPTDNNILMVMNKDETRSRYISRINYKVV